MSQRESSAGEPARRRHELRRSLWTVLMAIATVLGLTLSAEIYIPQAAGTTPATLTLQQLGFMTHINHIVYVVLENHAYDSYFGTYCLVASNLCPYAANGIPAGTCVPYSTSNPTGPCIRPWNFTTMNWTLKSDLPHNAGSSALAWNKGAMNGFYKAEGAGLDPFGHYNGTTAPIVWDLAEEYTLNDNFYSSVLSYSLPNHWHIVAGQAPSQIFTNGTEGCPTVPVNHTLTSDHLYLAQANKTTSIEDRLLNSSVSWKYYEFALGSYANAIKINLNANKTQITSVGQAYSYWNPQAAKAESYNASFVSHYVLNTQFYRDAKNGTLPDISWVIPPGQDSDHPPQSSAVAQGWLASIVNAVEASPEWNSTVLYITWDDYGGFYDHVDPPMWQGQQLGFRVPMIEISAWTRVGFVSNQMNYFESILRLMEWRFGLKCIATLDCKAPLPLWGFDWNLKGPHSPILFPTNIASASYPYNPKWDGSAGVEVGGYVPPTEYTYFPQGQAPDID